jgi:hypothetical protein
MAIRKRIPRPEPPKLRTGAIALDGNYIKGCCAYLLAHQETMLAFCAEDASFAACRQEQIEQILRLVLSGWGEVEDSKAMQELLTKVKAIRKEKWTLPTINS